MDKSLVEKNVRAKKMMLWFSMISMTMTFAGLTSAYVVSSSRADWLEGFEMPTAFNISTIIIVLSSLSFFLAKQRLKQEQIGQFKLLLWATLALTLLFVYYQFQGFAAIIAQGYYFTGPQSSITTSFLYVLVLLHIAHLVGGIVVLLVVLTRAYMGKYSAQNILGIELAELFWHFLDFLWLYLFVFLSIYQ